MTRKDGALYARPFTRKSQTHLTYSIAPHKNNKNKRTKWENIFFVCCAFYSRSFLALVCDLLFLVSCFMRLNEILKHYRQTQGKRMRESRKQYTMRTKKKNMAENETSNIDLSVEAWWELFNVFIYYFIE